MQVFSTFFLFYAFSEEKSSFLDVNWPLELVFSSEKLSMDTSMSFAETLESLLEKDFSSSENVNSRSKNGVFPSEKPSFTDAEDYIYLSFLLGKTPKTQLPRQTLHTDYRRYYVPSRPKPPRKVHVLSTEQRLAFEKLLNFYPDLSPGFRKEELKTAFRKGAMRTHPDRGGHSSEFQSLKEAYAILAKMPGL